MLGIIRAAKNLGLKGLWAVCLACFLCISSLGVATPSYATSEAKQPSEEIVQPFELTRPAESREQAYEEAAKLAENPKELIKAQNEEEKAREEALGK